MQRYTSKLNALQNMYGCKLERLHGLLLYAAAATKERGRVKPKELVRALQEVAAELPQVGDGDCGATLAAGGAALLARLAQGGLDTAHPAMVAKQARDTAAGAQLI